MRNCLCTFIAVRLISTHPTCRVADVGLLSAKALEGLNRLDEALAGLKVLADTYPGEEGRWRYRTIRPAPHKA